MPRFFSNRIFNDIIEIIGDDAKHICKVLRMSIGDRLVVCDLNGNDYDCIIKSLDDCLVVLSVEKRYKSIAEPDVKITLYQGFTKGAKFDFIVQKSVELGVNKIVPVIMNRCVSKPDIKSQLKRNERYNRIAFEAAKQSGRANLPVVLDFCSYFDAIDKMKNDELAVLFYEKSNVLFKSLGDFNKIKNISIMIGPEGGFEESEIKMALNMGIKIASMGKRILRCETASLYALSVIMFQTGN